MAAFAGLFALFALLWLVFAIVLPLWVYSDAQRNSTDSPVLWALVAFFGGVLGFLLYLIIGRD
ncbi:PLDc N-terminal domain-containing protein [Halobacterium zhouii]|uniref:PLDc N-terminal domain-containing protein n=1 Tax=Halobacterium zhouii TaxID=2902624 RepID=UPI001E45C46B|nr:PLDc N-terminal domain-containing protein [Halobacterium zhouii]